MMIFFAILAGVNIVFSRFLNSGNAEKNGLSMSTLMNYITGLVTSLIVLLLVREPGSFLKLPAFGVSSVLMFLGGTVGVITILLSNHLTPRMPAFLMTLLIFISQLLTALVLDYWLRGAFSLGRLAGGLLVLAGLWHYQRVHNQSDLAKAKKAEPAKDVGTV